jgi:midasin
LERSENAYRGSPHKTHILQRFLRPLENMMKCVEMGWMTILIGPSASGKTSLVRLLAELTRNNLYEFSMNTGVDTTELLGKHLRNLLNFNKVVLNK